MSTPAKADTQQLKSVRDDLVRRFRENDQAINMHRGIPTAVAVNARHRIQRKQDKITKQIGALNNIIKYLETQTQ